MFLLKIFLKMFLGKDVTEAVEEAKKSPKTFIYKKRVMGPLLAGTATVASYGLGIEIDREKVNVLIDSWNTIAISGRQIYQLITVDVWPALLAGWGAIMTIKGVYDAKVRAVKNGGIKPVETENGNQK